MCSYCTTPVYNGNNTLGGYTCITCRAWVPYNSLHDARTAPVIDGRDDDPIWSLASAIIVAITTGQASVLPGPVRYAAHEDTLVTVDGLVLDVACAVQNPATATRFNLQCAQDCVELGSPLIILGADGVLYVPMSTAIPDSSQRSRLLRFLGKFVRVKGTVLERSGLHAITIASIEEVLGIHLITDAQ